MTILHIDSSIQAEGSISRTMTAAIVAAIADGTGERVIHRDLTSEAPASINPRAGDSAAADEFLAADVIVIGAPMYNLSVPSRLKAWIDLDLHSPQDIPLYREGARRALWRPQDRRRLRQRWLPSGA